MEVRSLALRCHGVSTRCHHVSARYRRGIARVDPTAGRVDSRGVGIAVLGPLSIDGVATVLGRRDRAVLSALAVSPGEVLSADQLAEVLWQDEPPASWAKVIQGCVVRLRKLLGPGSIETLRSGYRLTLAHDQIDAQRFERAIERARALLNDFGDADRAAFVIAEALALWRGQALARRGRVGPRADRVGAPRRAAS